MSQSLKVYVEEGNEKFMNSKISDLTLNLQ